MDREVVIPEVLRLKADAEGAPCQRWLSELGGLVGELEREWAMAVGATLSGGTASFVAEAVTADGTPAVIKLAMPSERDIPHAIENEVRVLRLANGRACVRLLHHDSARGALLLERLGRQLVELGLPVRAQMEIICTNLEQLWAVPPDLALPSSAQKGRWLRDFMLQAWEDLNRPCSTRAIEQAVAFAERRSAGFDAASAVLLHGDAHAWNTLEDTPSGRPGSFKFVDPDGLVGEREYDLAILMREFTDELLAGDALRIGQERARFLAHLTGLDERKIWEWSVVERVSNGLLCLLDGMTQPGLDCLRVAEYWTDVACS